MLASTILTMGATGSATWAYGPFPSAPRVIATPVATAPITVTISSVTTSSVTVNAWTAAGAPSVGRVVHVVAFGP